MKTVLALLAALASARAQDVEILWNKVQGVAKTVPTLQVVVNPPLRPGAAIHDRVYSELAQLKADYVRYVPWLPYPRLAVAELEPPAAGRTHWDFSLIDPMTIDFLEATRGHPVILNFSTIPAWLFRTAAPISYPADPDEVSWGYTQGTELRDPSLAELGAYYARLVAWYTQGGFTDELGLRHESGHHYRIDYWEVLNEPDLEHHTGPEEYTKRYDAIVSAIRKVAPAIKFVGISVARPSDNPRYFEYFLDRRHHRPGIPIDMISYHFYAHPAPDETPDVQSHTFFEQADGFITAVRYIEQIRRRLSPSTGTMINEIGSILPQDDHNRPGGMSGRGIPAGYWNLSGALYAYVFAHLAPLGIDVAGESQLVGCPNQFPTVTMVDWKNGAPNARFRVLELIKDTFHPGDRIVPAAVSSASPISPTCLYAYAVVTVDGARKVLLINQRNRDLRIALPERAAAIDCVDVSTGAGPPQRESADSKTVELKGLSVAVVTLQP